jgi:hypothetical protein
MGDHLETYGSDIMNIFDSSRISRIRRNHGLEHATIHLLSRRYPGRAFAGHSDSGGFWLWGNVATEDLAETVTEAITRLQKGETGLAIHPNCGTNFVAYGALAGLGAFIALLGANRTRDKLERLPLIALFATIGLILAQPLGFRLQQRYTTSADLGDLQIMKVLRYQNQKMVYHRVTTQG